MSFIPSIPKEEYGQRIDRLRAVMKRDGIDFVMAFSNLLDPSVVRYYSDFSAVNESAAIIVPIEGEVTLCSGQASYDYALIKNRLEKSVIKVFPEIGEVSGFEYDFEGQMDFTDLFKEIKAKSKVKKIALIGRLTFPAIIYRKIENIFPEAQIIDYDDSFNLLRLIKTKAEIDCIRKASNIVSSVFQLCTDKILVGQTELEIAGVLEGEMLKQGAESNVLSFAPMVATGKVNSHVSMGRPSSRKIREGEILNLAAGACYEGYNGIICTPHVCGVVPKEINEAVKCAYGALNKCFSLLKPGTSCDAVLNAYTDYLEKYNYLDYCPYGSLHSTGLLECEAPTFTIKNKRIIEENMVICIDAYFKGMPWGSFRIEDNYLITSNGAERLTTFNDNQLKKTFKL